MIQSHTSNLSRTSSVVLFQGGPYPSHRVTDRAEDILKEKQTPYHLQLFSGVEHEFALGGDMFTHIKGWRNRSYGCPMTTGKIEFACPDIFVPIDRSCCSRSSLGLFQGTIIEVQNIQAVDRSSEKV